MSDFADVVDIFAFFLLYYSFLGLIFKIPVENSVIIGSDPLIVDLKIEYFGTNVGSLNEFLGSELIRKVPEGNPDVVDDGADSLLFL